MQDLHTTVHYLSMEGGPHGAAKADEHLPHMRPSEELLSMLHAGLVLWPAHRRQRRGIEDGCARSGELYQPRVLCART